MGIYLFDKIRDNFIAAGFDVDTFQFKGEDSVFFACRRYEGILHVIVASQRVDGKLILPEAVKLLSMKSA